MIEGSTFYFLENTVNRIKIKNFLDKIYQDLKFHIYRKVKFPEIKIYSPMNTDINDQLFIPLKLNTLKMPYTRRFQYENFNLT